MTKLGDLNKGARRKKGQKILSPRMQRSIRVNEGHLCMLSDKAQFDNSQAGYLHKRSSDSSKWQLRWFILYQNLLFYYDSENSIRPSGVLLLEGAYCQRLIGKLKDSVDKQFSFAISYRRENLKHYELRALNEVDCKNWIDAIREASFNKLLLQKEELEQKHVHLVQILEAEKTAKWQYTQQCEEMIVEIKKLRSELIALKKEYKPKDDEGATCLDVCFKFDHESSDLRKIKKVQSFFRGWLCRRRWKQIVEQYIKSPHAEIMRKRNNLVFRMVESEEEYMEQMEVLVSCFLRPFKMAASSKKPPCTHEDVNSIFLNSETVLFLHQIFLKGLSSRLENWPTLVLGDLFTMLLPMLSIYQEYVRNHHYSLQILTECKQSLPFVNLLKRLESKPLCRGRTLETFLTYPMHQVPRYIITLHELLAHTPHDHVERKSLQEAKQRLEDLSRQMHDEVSETENLRKNLAVERMIVEGCDILLDVNQVFVRQGTLIQLPTGKQKLQKTKFNFKTEKEYLRQCFLFSNHLIITTRSSSGRLHLVPDIGKIPLSNALLIEEPSAITEDGETSMYSAYGHSVTSETTGIFANIQNRDFKIIVEMRDTERRRVPRKPRYEQACVHLMAATLQDKAAWVSDLTQCLDNAQFNDLLRPPVSDTSSVTLPQSIKNDPRLFKDEADIRFSRTLNSCKIPQIRYATPERLLQRLTDGITVLEALKKVFYNPETEYQDSFITFEPIKDDHTLRLQEDRRRSSVTPRRISGASSVSGYCSELSEKDRSRSHSYDSQGHKHWKTTLQKYEEENHEDKADHASSHAYKSDPTKQRNILETSFEIESVSIMVEESRDENNHLSIPKAEASSSSETLTDTTVITATLSRYLSSETLIGSTSSDSNGSDETSKKTEGESENMPSKLKALASPKASFSPKAPASPKSSASPKSLLKSEEKSEFESVSSKPKTSASPKLSTPLKPLLKSEEKFESEIVPSRPKSPASPKTSASPKVPASPKIARSLKSSSTLKASASFKATPSLVPTSCKASPEASASSKAPVSSKLSEVSTTSKTPEVPTSFKAPEILASSKAPEVPTSSKAPTSPKAHFAIQDLKDKGKGNALERDKSEEIEEIFEEPSTSKKSNYTFTKSTSITPRSILQAYYGSRKSKRDGQNLRASIQHESPHRRSKAGVVITSSRPSRRRSSTSSAATAFAIATSASSNPRDLSPGSREATSEEAERARFKESVISTACTMRVLNVLRHWIAKHAQDFEVDRRLKTLTIEFLEDIISSPNLLPTEHKSAAQLLRLLSKDDPESPRRNLLNLICPPVTPTKESIETLSALELAEQMTYLDYQIFISISSEEFLGQGWMKSDKHVKAPNILLMTRHFNEISRLISCEIIRKPNIHGRVGAIEKWTAVADIARCLHNFNGVLQICSAFTSSAIYRLRKTWDKVPKTTKQTIDKLQRVVSSDGRFRALREALHRCDPPCIPYLGIYLTDLSFIEEGNPNFTSDGLLNFSKMRMIAHVIREIRRFQQTKYKIDLVPRVSSYLLDNSTLLNDEDLYKLSLKIEPRNSKTDESPGKN